VYFHGPRHKNPPPLGMTKPLNYHSTGRFFQLRKSTLSPAAGRRQGRLATFDGRETRGFLALNPSPGLTWLEKWGQPKLAQMKWSMESSEVT